MPLDSDEAITDGILAVGLGKNIIDGVKALPPKASRKAADYGPLLGVSPDGNFGKLLALIDQVEADIAD